MSTTADICLSMKSIVSASREQVSSELAGEVVILNLNAGVYHGLDATGARIWQLIQTPKSITTLLDTLLAEYDVEADRCEHDLLDLLKKLAANGLLDVHPDPAP